MSYPEATFRASYFYRLGKDSYGACYDRIAFKNGSPSDEERVAYHVAYKTWRDSGYTEAAFRLLLLILSGWSE